MRNLSDRAKWNVIGSLAAEVRGNTVALEMNRLERLQGCTLLRIVDEPSRFFEAVKLACDQNLWEVNSKLETPPDIKEMSLRVVPPRSGIYIRYLHQSTNSRLATLRNRDMFVQLTSNSG